MNLMDFMAALDEAVHPGLRRNRRRLYSAWANGFIELLAHLCAFMRAIPVAWQRIYHSFIPRRHKHQHLACGCCCRPHRHPDLEFFSPPRHRRHRHLHPKPGRKKKKIIRLDDSDLMRVDMSASIF